MQQQRTASTEAHFALVPLLEEYYDPMYRYQLGKSRENSLSRQLAGGRSGWRSNRMLYCPGLRRKRLSRATGRRDL